MSDSYTELDYWTRAELFARARDLAFSILPIDEVANEIAFEAMHGAQLCRNKKKHHKDNYKYRKYGPTRVLLQENQLVQAYVYRESEKYEKFSEGESNQKINPSLADLLKDVPLSEENLIVRYLKFLIQISNDNSINAVLVLTRLICSYSTRDAAEVYMYLHSDAPEENYFSKRKWEFMKRLEERFQTLIQRGVLTVCIGKKREKYFYGQESPSSCWVGVTKDYLKLFTPWGTSCLLAGTEGSLMEKFLERLEKIFSKDKRDLNCIHTTLCPDCCAKLMKDLSLPDPGELLTLPRFNLDREGGEKMDGGNRRRHPEPEKAEVETVLRFLDHETDRRKRAALAGIKKISILIDGEQEKILDLSRSSTIQFTVDETLMGSSRLIKVYSEDEEGILLLATLLLNRSEAQPSLAGRLLGRKRYPILEGRQKIELAVTYSEGGAEYGQFAIEIMCREGSGNESPSFLPLRLTHPQIALAIVLLALVLAVPWLVFKNRQPYAQVEETRKELRAEPERNEKQEVEPEQKAAGQDQEIAQLKQPHQSTSAVLLNPDLDIGRDGGTGVGPAKPTILANTRLIQFQLYFESREKYESYRAVLTFERDTDQIWSKKILNDRPQRNGRSIVLTIPSNIFTEGDYRLTLKGESTGTEEEEIDTYSFRVLNHKTTKNRKKNF